MFELLERKKSFLIAFLVLAFQFADAQILHDNSCSSISTQFTLDWDATPTASQYNWTPQGGLTFTASNIEGSGNSIGFAVTGATGTLTTENSISTPGITNSLSGGVDALHLSSTGLSATEQIVVTMTFSPALAGDISFDIYNVIELAGGGAGGQQIEVFGLTSAGFALVPEITDNGSPSWELEGPAVLDGNATSTAGTNDQMGVNFRSISDISTITVTMRRCSGCGNAANTEFAIGDIDICLTPDTDQDGISDTQDQDDDNDGILDIIEKCPTSARSLADWDDMTYNDGDASNTYNLPDGTNMTVAVASNGASLVAGETSTFITGGQGAGTVGLFLNGNQNLQVNSIDVSFSWDQAIDSLEFTIFDIDQISTQWVDSVTIIGFYSGFVVFPALTGSANNTVFTNRGVGASNTIESSALANVDVAFSEPIDSLIIFYGNGATAPAAPGNQWISIWDFSYIGDCGTVDADGDGIDDYLDIDSDNDGIVDYIEWQGSTASPIAPAGADADNDGIDNNFEGVPAPIDTDGDGIPDFQDPDSDDDGDTDQLEAYDTDNDGTANTLPANTDTDGDGLDDNFDNVVGFNPTTNITNNGQTSSTFPDLDGESSERDWREDTDIDNDGVQDYADLDDDNDGILDVNEGKGSNNPTGDEDGDGIPNWADVADAGNGGDGTTSDYTDSNGDGIPDVYDADNDGIPNHHDPDSDGDGIADIVEAGGTDADGNGIVDGAFSDGDGDGWSATFDSDDGGTALTDVDQDSDGLQNHTDIDSDNDGIVDLIESQASTASPTIPSGTDTDGDGIDDNFDTNSGNNLITPVNTESFDNPDYLDSNSDNDLDSDQVEAYDTDNDGTANTLPAGADADNDGLDDNFDNVAGQNSTTNITNSGQTSNTFPNLDVPGTSELDWRETGNITDNDGDGVADASDVDDDNDGILDTDECGTVVSTLTSGGTGSYTVTVDGDLIISMNGGDGGGGSARAGGSGATIAAVFSVTNGDVVRYVVGSGSTGSGAGSAGGAGSSGLFINNTLMMVAGGGGGGDNSGAAATGLGASATTSGLAGTGSNGPGAAGTAGGGGGASNTGSGGGGGINAAGTSSSAGGGSAADLVPGDGVTAVPGGAASGGSNTAGAAGFTGGGGAAGGFNSGGAGGYSGGGAAGDGGAAGGGGSFLNTGDPTYVSGSITAGTVGGGGAAGVTGTDGFVTITTCGDTDNDGIIDSFDPDSDGDGIADIIEAGGVDADGNGLVDGVFADTDGDGWSDVFDSDDGGTALTDADTDADGFENRVDIDSDDDGIIDIIESQATGTLISPSGVDMDGDGIDDNFDTDEGNSLTSPVNTDAADNPDYTDTDSDNDGDSDALEAYDTDNDGTANTTAAGSDTDNDGLDDNFDNIVGPNATTNVTNNGQTSSTFPNLDRVNTPERDWREDMDNDNDGVVDFNDIDDDNDGILDTDECNGNGSLGEVTNSTVVGTGSYTAPADGTVSITINGGDGGGGSANPGGSGATITANIDVSNADIIRYVVGGGSAGTASSSAGGAGSTGLFINNDLVMVAGGGAGGDNSAGAEGFGASATTTGRSGDGTSPGAGGVGGAGGTVGGSSAGAGGGINSAGGSATAGGGTQADLVPGDGVTLVAGGASSGGGTTAGASGFTGGGGSESSAFAGGGGGYSGGGAAGSGGGGQGSAGGGGSFLNTGVTGFVSGGITAGVDGGGAATGANNGADGFVTIFFASTCTVDTDNDGIVDSFDPDSDGDGIADIIEAGGVDADGNGMVDGAFSDADGDGWSATFDSDDGGTALTDADVDADGSENRIDIDSDDDGIVDLIESQTSTASPTIPSGTDTDGDGIDDNFDTDSGNSLTAPTNTDGTDNPDYTDTNSDNDSQLDAVEAYDSDNDGVADTGPAGSDTDGDGLDNNYDNIVGPNATTNATNGGQSSSSFPNQDVATSSERDWREIIDADGDGVEDGWDIDSDNDGILDSQERNCTSGFASVLTDGGSTANPSFALGIYNGTDATLGNGDILILDLTDTVPAGHTVRLLIARTNTNRLLVEGSVDNVTYTSGVTYGIDNADVDMPVALQDMYLAHPIGTNGARFIRFTREAGGQTVDAVGYQPQCPTLDTDGDGVEDYLDLDSDNDGIADIIEAGGTDANNDGRADSNTDTDGDGYADTFDADNAGTALTVADTDGDGIENYMDLDSDSDGIIDNVEGQTTLGFRNPQNTDSDGDGWDDEYDSDNGGTAITLSNNEGAGNVDYLDDDSDGDGLFDWTEGFDDNNSEDALDDFISRADAFETAAGNPLFYVNANDADMDGIPDWLEDTDADNVPNFLDPDNALFQDTDTDGIVDLFDTDNFGAVSNLPNGDADGEPDFRDPDNQISLPITLVSFDAVKDGNRALITWVTSSEINNDYFTIERSSDADSFVPIMMHDGAGNSNREIGYQMYDKNPLKGVNYYRLRQTDFDGETDVFNIEVVNFDSEVEGDGEVSIYPNPNTEDNMYIQFSNMDAGRYLLQIRDVHGKLVRKETMVLDKEYSNTIRMIQGIHLLSKGVYMISISNTLLSKEIKYIVQ